MSMPNPDPRVGSHLNRTRRRAMSAMAKACGIDPNKYGWEPAGIGKLWGEISEAIAGGVQHPSEPVIGDPFAVFVTGICQNLDSHPTHLERRQTAVVKTGQRVDQFEGERIIAYLKAQENVNTCDVCHRPFTVWSTDNTRVSTFAAQDKARLSSRFANTIVRT